MLSDAEKNQILEQEIYRREVAQQLDTKQPKSTRKTVWEMLNSAIVLWLLSTVVVGLISFGYARWDKQRTADRLEAEQAAAKKREDRLAERKIDAEIASRLAYVHSVTRLQKVKQSAFASALRTLEDPSREPYSVSVFPEYSKRSLRSLLWELLQVLPPDVSSEEKQRIAAAYQRARLLPTIYTLAETYKPASHAQDRESAEVDGLARANLNTVMGKFFDLQRWDKPFTWEKHGTRLKAPVEGTDAPAKNSGNDANPAEPSK